MPMRPLCKSLMVSITANGSAAGLLSSHQLASQQYIKHRFDMNTAASQIFELMILAIPVACIAWTVTHEEVFREPREYCVDQSKKGFLPKRKFFYLFTCEYCFSHYVSLALIALTHFRLLYADWKGYLVSFFALVWVANIYMGLYARIRIDIKKDRVIIAEKEQGMREANTGDTGQS